MTEQTREFWDEQADTFDDEADHGLRSPEVRRAWTDLLIPLLPGSPARIADLGCGTGSLSVLFAEAGHLVHGIDLAPRMIEAAQAKAAAARVRAEFAVGDAAGPPLEPGAFDVVVARHVLWMFPDPENVLARWIELLAPDGVLVLVEGHWTTGAGIPAEICRSLVLQHRKEALLRKLPDAELWGKEIDDERYLIVSRR